MNEESFIATFRPDHKSEYSYRIPQVAELSDNLSKDLSEQATRFLWFDSLCSRLVAKRDHLSNELKALLATTEIEYRRSVEKTTENAVKAFVEVHPAVTKLKHALAEAEAELNMCYSIRNAFVQRKDMLVALGANLRAELNAMNPSNIRS